MDQDSEVLSTIFSNEVWMLVLHKFVEQDAFNDVENSINASLHFRKLLRPKLTTDLFPKVFENLVVKYGRKPSDAYREEPRKLSDDEWNAYVKSHPFGNKRARGVYESEDEIDEPPDKIKMNHRIVGQKKYPGDNVTVLKLRLVCQTWNKEIDKFYENLPSHYKMNHDRRVHRKFAEKKESWSVEKFISKKFQNAVKFLNHFDSTHSTSTNSKNPFVGRAIAIRELPSTSGDWHYLEKIASAKDRIFWDTITSILQKHGHHIWYCEISCRNKFPSLVHYYRQIRDWISLMSNLKVLHISYCMKPYNPTFPTKKQLETLQKEIETNPMPTLENLRFLKTRKLPPPIFNEIMLQNSNTLEMVEVIKNEVQSGYVIYSDNMPMQNLKKLSIQLFTKTEFKMLSKSLEKIKLEKLYLDFDQTAEFVEWSEIFKALQESCGTDVSNLMINLPVAKTDKQIEKLVEEASTYRLDMPFVKRFKLVISNQVPIDFILPMKNSLEILEVYLGYQARKSKRAQQTNQTINFVGFEKSWMESNIWEMFPKLKHIYVDTSDPSKYGTNRWMGERKQWEDIRNKGSGQTLHIPSGSRSRNTRALRSKKNM